MKLLFDLGNTRLKWAWWDSEILHFEQPIAHAATDFSEQLVAQLQRLPFIQSAWAASVANEKLNTELVHIVRKTCGVEVKFMHSSAIECGVRNAYAIPERLGVDRFLALIAVRQNQIEPVVLASSGTALTLDAMTQEGVHLGGLILPSPDVMQQAIVKRTSRVKFLHQAQLTEMANNTEDAVYSGTWLAAVALIERFVAQSTSRFGQTPQLILTGGGAETLEPLLKIEHRMEPDLVLRGLFCVINVKKAEYTEKRAPYIDYND